ncbi:MAG: ATP cone domain-containing protein [Tissierellia bacterium]|nr:ATP cone domain-containing protein [Tissierellia bacterium]
MNDNAYEKLVREVADFLNKEGIPDTRIMSFLEKMRMDILNERVKDSDSLFVLKRKGWIEEFNEEKLSANLATASDNIKQSLTDSELQMIIKGLKDKIRTDGKKVVPSGDILSYVEEILSDLGYERIREYYRIFNGR